MIGRRAENTLVSLWRTIAQPSGCRSSRRCQTSVCQWIGVLSATSATRTAAIAFGAWCALCVAKRRPTLRVIALKATLRLNKTTSYRFGAWLLALGKHNMASVDLNLGFNNFCMRYARGAEEGEGPSAHAPELRSDRWEWKRSLLMPGQKEPFCFGAARRMLSIVEESIRHMLFAAGVKSLYASLAGRQCGSQDFFWCAHGISKR